MKKIKKKKYITFSLQKQTKKKRKKVRGIKKEKK